MGTNLSNLNSQNIQKTSARIKETTKLPEIIQQRTEEIKKGNVKQAQISILPSIYIQVKNNRDFKREPKQTQQTAKKVRKGQEILINSCDIILETFDYFMLKPLKQITTTDPFIITQYIWIKQYNQETSRNIIKKFRQKKLNLICCSSINQMSNILEDGGSKYFNIITSQIMIQQIYNLCYQNRKVTNIFLLYQRDNLNIQEYKIKYKKVTMVSKEINQLIKNILKKKKFDGLYKSLPFMMLIDNNDSEQKNKLKKTRLKFHSMLNFSNKLQAKCDFQHLTSYLFFDSQEQKQKKFFEIQFSTIADFDLVLSFFTSNSYYCGFINKFLSVTIDPLIIPYIRFLFERTFRTIITLYQQCNLKQNQAFWKGNLNEQQLSFFSDNRGKCIELFGFLLTTKNKKRINKVEGNTLIIINIDKQKRKPYDYGYIQFSQYNFKSFKNDEILFNALNTFKILSFNRDNNLNIIQIQYGQIPRLLLRQTSITDYEITITKQYAQQMQIISKCLNHGEFLKQMQMKQYITYKQICQRRKKEPQLGFISMKVIQNLQKKQIKYKKMIEFLKKNNSKIIKNLSQQSQFFKSDLYKKIANIYRYHKQFKLARQSYDKQLKIEIQNFGEKHSKIVNILYDIGITYDMQASYQQEISKQVVLRVDIQKYYQFALQYFQKCRELQLNISGQFNQKIASIIGNMALIYDNFGEYDKAIKLYEKALKITHMLGNQNNIQTAKLINNIGAIYECQSKFDLALQMYLKSLKLYTQIIGPDQLKTSLVLINIANIYYIKNKLKQSLKYYERAYQIRKYLYGKKHGLTLDILKRIKMIEHQEQISNFE